MGLEKTILTLRAFAIFVVLFCIVLYIEIAWQIGTITMIGIALMLLFANLFVGIDFLYSTMKVKPKVRKSQNN